MARGNWSRTSQYMVQVKKFKTWENVKVVTAYNKADAVAQFEYLRGCVGVFGIRAIKPAITDEPPATAPDDSTGEA